MRLCKVQLSMTTMPVPAPDRIRLRREFNATAMVGEVTALISTEWTRHFVTQNYEGDWSVIPLRGPRGQHIR
ncbi:MAG: hypothetical protein O3C21_11785 [Verrucomicrobia bacterium]|nr:hypothetical protein [Verrucomicrobiota bacterium]